MRPAGLRRDTQRSHALSRVRRTALAARGLRSLGHPAPWTTGKRKATAWDARLTTRHGILGERTFDRIDGHHAHSEISAMRDDPGPLFDWRWVL